MTTMTGLLALCCLCSTLLLAVVATDYPEPDAVSGNVAPVHDPSMARSPDGTYFLFSTGIGIDIRTSTDRVNWTYAGAAFPKGLPWCHPYTRNTDMIWAPDISYHPERVAQNLDPYVIYYACSGFGSKVSAIFHASSRTGKPGEWTHRGKVVESGPDFTNLTTNAIDPNLAVDRASGEWWLDFGSYHSGIKMIKLNATTGLRDSKDQGVRNVASRAPGSNGAIEAAYIYYREPFYYLFVSWDYCCQALQSNYRVMVGKSANVTGPYSDRDGVPMQGQGGGTQVVASHGANVHGPGHNAALFDPSSGGQDLLIYHYYYSPRPWPDAKLGINVLQWDDKDFPYIV